MKNAPEPMFRFQVCTDEPTARVTCNHCGWKVMGDDADIVFPLADAHICRTGVGR